MIALAARAQTTTSSTVPKIVGEPLDPWVVLGAGLALFVVVVVGGLLLRRRTGERQH